jgi:threonine dehydratase
MTAHSAPRSQVELPTIGDVLDAAVGLDGIATRTPVLRDDLLDERTGSAVTVKAEFLQRGGAYKFRGIYNKVRLLTAEARRPGIVISSSGNAGIAAAHAARLHRVPCIVVMPADAAQHKMAAIEALGGRVIRHGASSTEMDSKARELAADGLAYVHPFDQPEVIAGHGTMALELLEQTLDIDALLVPAAGGGMLAGTSLVVGAQAPGLHLIGVQPEGAASLHESLQAGSVQVLDRVDTIADGLRVRRCGDLTFELIRRRTDQVVLVSDDAILDAIAVFWRVLHVAVEPAGAIALAAALTSSEFRGQRIGIVASGANIDPMLLQRALAPQSADTGKKASRG